MNLGLNFPNYNFIKITFLEETHEILDCICGECTSVQMQNRLGSPADMFVNTNYIWVFPLAVEQFVISRYWPL